MPETVTQKLIGSHLVSGSMTPGDEIAIRIDQTLTQDATGTLVMQELEALGLDRARTEVSVQYVDHNLLQTDEKNAEDHEYLRTAAQRFGLWFSKPGNGVSHPTHMQRFGIPGKTASAVRRFGISAVDRIAPLKDRFMAEARGESGELPRLLQGEAV